ncbi:MAG: hypothetical protein U0350_39500 [Caldilineaceae bacterium]
MPTRIRGPFEVKLVPQAAGEGEEATIGQLLLDKQFHIVEGKHFYAFEYTLPEAS